MLKAWRKSDSGAHSDIFVFKADDLIQQAEECKAGYYTTPPYPHTVIDDFLPGRAADRLLSVFPPPDAGLWLDWRQRDAVHQPLKQGIGNADRLEGTHPFVHNMIFAFNSYPLIHFLETLTGIEGLLPDPHLFGGGLHQILPGGRLAIHADFNYLDDLKLYRRINLLLFLNKGWKEEYAGHLEMWDRAMQQCVKRVLPIFNRCVIFNTESTSYHGHPQPLACPQGVTRKSLAFYYYTSDNFPDGMDPHLTLWQQRPGDV
jgi:hypothetical protein